MNVFILSTGRCGSTTFIKACEHIENFGCGHETLAGQVGDQRLAYPENHIEADNRLSWYLGRLHFKFGEDAFYVHLKRDLEATARSYARRKHMGVMNAFASGLLRQANLSPEAQDPMNLARDVCHTMEENIRHFLLDKPQKLEIQLESIASGFEEFWSSIQATGNLERALACFQRRTNTSQDFARVRDQVKMVPRIRRAARMAWRMYQVPNRDTSFFDRRSVGASDPPAPRGAGRKA